MPVSEILQHGFKLGEIQVKPSEGLVIVGGQPRHVEPKAMDVLLVLAGASQELVSREDLISQVWPRGYVTDDALNRCISKLRRALGDNSRTPRFIVTVPRRGYRLASPVQLSASPADQEGTLVLPFQNLSQAGDDYLADGLTELLIARLSVTLEQPVISRTTAMTFRNSGHHLRSIRDQLGVRWVVEGSVLQLGEQVQVVVQLIDADSDSHVWADTWTRALGDTLTLLNEISRQVAARIRRELEPDLPEAPGMQALPTDLLRQFLHGLQLISKRTHAALQQSIACFGRVLEQVHNHAPSLSGQALAWLLLAHYDAVPASEGFDKARRYARVALQASSEPQADALACLAAVEFFHDWDFGRAQTTVERALTVNRNHDIGLLVAADIGLVKGRNEQAQSYMDRALERDPLNTGL